MAPLEYTLTMTRPPGSSTKPVDCRYRGPGLMKAPVMPRDGVGVGAMTDREPQAMPGDQVLCGGLVVHRQGDDRDIRVGEAVQRPLERAELGVAVGAPRSPVVQDDAEVAGQGIGQPKGPAAGVRYG